MVRPDHWRRHVGGPDHIGGVVDRHCCHRAGCPRSSAEDPGDYRLSGYRLCDCRCVGHRRAGHHGAADADHYPTPDRNAVPNGHHWDHVAAAGGSSCHHRDVVAGGSSCYHRDVAVDDSSHRHPDVVGGDSNRQGVVAEVCSSREVVHPNHYEVGADGSNDRDHDKNHGRDNIDPSKYRHRR